MKKILLIFSLTFVYSVTQAQDYPEFGKFSQADFDLESYPDDAEAGAVVLFDKGTTSFIEMNGRLVIQFERHKRIKILNESELERSDISLRYYADGYGKTEVIKNIKATSNYLEDNQVKSVALDKKLIFDEKINQYWNIKRFSIPGAKPGSIIEFKYQLLTPFMFNLPDWEFQSDIPTIKSFYQVHMVPFYEYVFLLQNTQPLSFHETKKAGFDRYFAGVHYKHMVHSYEMKDIPAFYDDEYITGKDDYINKIDFQLARIYRANGSKEEVMNTWEELADDFLKSQNFGKYIKMVQKSVADYPIIQTNLSEADPHKKINSLKWHVAKKFDWNGFYGKYADQKPAMLEKSKQGSVADINLYLVGMLRAVGLNVQPLILSTRAHGKVSKKYPISEKFNYVVACVQLDDNIILVDATQTQLPYYLLPLRCLNDFGLVIEKEPYWLNLNSHFYSTTKKITFFEIQEDSMKVSVKESSNYYDAYQNRKKYARDNEEFVNVKLADHEKLIGDFKVHNHDRTDKDLILNYKKMERMEVFESKKYLTPFGSMEYLREPLRRKIRKYPVDFIYKKERQFMATIYLPENLEVETLPQNRKFDNNLVNLNYEVKKLNDAITIQASYKLKKSIYQPHEFDALRESLNRIHETLTSQIILRAK